MPANPATLLRLPPASRALLTALATRHKVTASALVADALDIWSGLDAAEQSERATYLRPPPVETRRKRALDAIRAAPAGLTRAEVAATAGLSVTAASAMLSQLHPRVERAEGRWVIAKPRKK